MKIWEVDGREVNLRGDTSRISQEEWRARLAEDAKRVAEMNTKIQRLIAEDFDDIIFWDRSDKLCQSPDAEDWQCGSFGPGGKVCLRMINHVGRCSDFFSPADEKCFCERQAARKREELGEIIGQPVVTTKSSSYKYDKEKLTRLLKEEDHA